jgi:hypothetical protein
MPLVVNRQGGRVRPLDPSDPRSLDHPCHEQQWLDLAGAIGRELARLEWERRHGTAKGDTNEAGGILR